jgi:hypothetical protein
MRTTILRAVVVLALTSVPGLLGLVANVEEAAGAKAPAQPAVNLRSWSIKENDATLRFMILDAFDGEAVLDTETQLGWERSPRTSEVQWLAALDVCTANSVGGRKAWRLPTVHEFASLIDPTVPAPGPELPPGHPFMNVETTLRTVFYWSSTTRTDVPTEAWHVGFADGDVFATGTNAGGRVWCVRYHVDINLLIGASELKAFGRVKHGDVP